MLNSECLEIFNKYLTEVKKCSQNTLSSYLRDIRQLSEYMETHVGDSLDKATNEELSGYISWLKGNGKSVATVSRAIASVKCFYGLLVTDGYIEENLKVKREHAYLIPNGNKLPFRPKGKVFYMENKEPKENY